MLRILIELMYETRTKIRWDITMMWCRVIEGQMGKIGNEVVHGTSSKLEEEGMWMNISEFLERNMEILTSTKTLGTNHAFIAVHTTAIYRMRLHQLFLYMFGPRPKCSKKESLSETISNAAIAITKAISPPSAVNLPTNQLLVISPGKSVDLRMKNRYVSSSSCLMITFSPRKNFWSRRGAF